MVAGVYALIRGNADGWHSAVILACFAACAVLLAAFGIVEARGKQPMLDLSLFRNPALAGASIGALGISATIFSVLLYLTLYLQDILRYSAFGTGLRFLPLSLCVLLAAPVSGRLSAHVPQRVLVGGGLVLIAAGLGLMAAISPSSGWTALLAGMIVSGIGSGLVNPALASAAVGSVSRDRAGVGSGINNTFRQLGIAVGIAGLGAIFTSRERTAFIAGLTARDPRLAGRAHALAGTLTSGGAGSQAATGKAGHAIALATRAAFVSGLHQILWVASVGAAVSAVLSAALMRTRSISSEPELSVPDEKAPARRAA